MTGYFCMIVGKRKYRPDGVNWDWAAGSLKVEGWYLYRQTFNEVWKWVRVI